MLPSFLLSLLWAPLLMLRLQSPSSFPRPLSAAEEAEYLSRLAAGDGEARAVLIERNLRLVAHIMKKYYAQAADQEDLLSIGTIGLIKGIESFDSSKGARLATYAARCVENEILMYFRAQRKSAQDVSLSDDIDAGRDSSALSFMDVLCDDTDLTEALSTREQHEQLLRYLHTCLTPRERKVLILRYGLGGRAPLPQREVAEQCAISRSYVSRIEKRALEKLRAAFARDDP